MNVLNILEGDYFADVVDDGDAEGSEHYAASQNDLSHPSGKIGYSIHLSRLNVKLSENQNLESISQLKTHNTINEE